MFVSGVAVVHLLQAEVQPSSEGCTQPQPAYGNTADPPSKHTHTHACVHPASSTVIPLCLPFGSVREGGGDPQALLTCW